MSKPLVILDPGHGGLGSFFYDMDNGVRLSHGWGAVERLEGEDKHYLCEAEAERWRAGERPTEPRFYFHDKGRRVTWGDTGSLSPLNPRLCEKDLTLDVARTVHRQLGRRVRIKETRDRDGYVSEASRAALAHRTVELCEGPAVMVSLHAEACADPRIGGCRVRPGGAEGSPELADELARALARHLTALGQERDPEQVRVAADGDGPTPAPPAAVALPAVTVNLGFLSNLADARRLLDRHLRHALAAVVARTLLSHLLGPGIRTAPAEETLRGKVPGTGLTTGGEGPGPLPPSVMFEAV